MNRRERRRLAAKARESKNHSSETLTTAVHEAGHAVARYLTAPDMGLASGEAETLTTAVHEAGHAVARYLTAPDMGLVSGEAIDSMVFQTANEALSSVSHDRRAILIPQATTYGPVFSSEMRGAEGRVTKRYVASGRTELRGREAFEFRAEIIKEARAEGADINRWLAARAAIAAAGGFVEAVYTRQDPEVVWAGYGAEADLKGVVEDCVASGIDTDQVGEIWAEGQRRAVALFTRPEVLRATEAVATAFAARRHLSGGEVVRIIEQATVLSRATE